MPTWAFLGATVVAVALLFGIGVKLFIRRVIT
jgi:hypothetical protein